MNEFIFGFPDWGDNTFKNANGSLRNTKTIIVVKHNFKSHWHIGTSGISSLVYNQTFTIKTFKAHMCYCAMGVLNILQYKR